MTSKILMKDYKSTFDSAKPSRKSSYSILAVIVIIGIGYFLLAPEKTDKQPVQDTQISALQIPGLSAPEQPATVSPEPSSLTNNPQVAIAPPADTQLPATVEPEVSTTTVKTDETERPVMSPTWESRTIKSGDSIANIFREWNLSASLLHKIVHSSKLAKSLADIHPGDVLKLQRDDHNELLELVVERSPIESLVISKTDDSFDSEIVTRKVDVQQAFAQGTITSSLFVDGQNAGLTDAQIMEMAGIFGWDIDFALELREGDSFKLLYEEHFLDGQKLKNGPILAAEFNNDGQVFKAVRYTTPDGNSSYYDPDDGRNKKRAFIRTPVKFARISSGFSNKRFHPKLKKWRAHRGVDYAAPTGTPVKAAGNGKVIFRGVKGGYGNVVILQHGTKYTTLYAHLSKFAKSAKNGRSVSQGQIIGYVGKSGLATGPHLHYEFRVNGVHRNPLTVKLPKADPIDQKYRADFDLVAAKLMDSIKLHDSQNNRQIALTDNDAERN